MLSRASVFQVRKPIAQLVRATSTTSSTSSAAAAAPAEVGYQRPVRQIEAAPVRYGFIPEEWFQFFYKKTGVTGPYAFGFSLFTYLASKEIYVMEHEYYAGLSFAALLIIGIKKLGPGVKKALDAEVDQIEADFEQGRKDEVANLEDLIEHEKTEQWRAEGQLMLNDAQKENVSLQLEAAYRERLAQVFNEVKRRLDYQVEIQLVERRVKQKHLVNWVSNKVLGSITPDQDKETLSKCIADLGALAPK
ncbi:ATP synthase subunit b, mitochondrial [Sitodiplosis mosellana]|uniref:ATP synthase subunit b, mitochondrial n=1 Tax=Sitodiplosis mosellana TaxID=263140 RepID=UPI002443E38F|nr:ATP synthase subunit b, mitochondrial [Sitodiplosis mosellana]